VERRDRREDSIHRIEEGKYGETGPEVLDGEGVCCEWLGSGGKGRSQKQRKLLKAQGKVPNEKDALTSCPQKLGRSLTRQTGGFINPDDRKHAALDASGRNYLNKSRKRVSATRKKEKGKREIGLQRRGGKRTILTQKIRALGSRERGKKRQKRSPRIEPETLPSS